MNINFETFNLDIKKRERNHRQNQSCLCGSYIGNSTNMSKLTEIVKDRGLILMKIVAVFRIKIWK